MYLALLIFKSIAVVAVLRIFSTALKDEFGDASKTPGVDHCGVVQILD